MKKSVIILIAIIYIASIVVINFFGMKMSVYNEIIPVTSIECINTTDAENNIEVLTNNTTGKKVIKIKFVEPADKDTLKGTMFQLQTHVYPDNATTKEVKYVYNENPNFEFFKDASDTENGLILFYGRAMFDVKIMSTDGRKITAELRIWAY